MREKVWEKEWERKGGREIMIERIREERRTSMRERGKSEYEREGKERV